MKNYKDSHFEKGAVGAIHHHPHTQITYVVCGQFEFEIDGVKKIVKFYKNTGFYNQTVLH